MTDRKLLALALTVALVLSVVAGGGTLAVLSDSEVVTTELDVEIPAAGNAPGNAGNAPGNAPGSAGNAPGNAPGNAGNAPGNAPGNAGNAPGKSGDVGFIQPGGVEQAEKPARRENPLSTVGG